MRIVELESLPRQVREIPHVTVPMPDGCRLAARVWLPEDAGTAPVPAILEYIPYRKSDGTAQRDVPAAAWLAGHGYAYVRLDLRGAGDSEGVLRDEYLARELEDGRDAIAWIAAQPWCDGRVGMTGISWGGFNGLQIAALGPPALKAVITVCSTDDRYADDIHYMGGCLLGEQLSWSAVMFGLNTLPPDPAHVGPAWREMWRGRLEGAGLWLSDWLCHQRRDAYWRHGSVCEDFSAIEVPVYAVSGWADGYCRAVFRLLEGLDVPRKGLIGPWAHKYPHMGVPGPAIGWMQEQLRWWDHWLKGRETGIMDEPMLRLFMQESVPPAGFHAERAGRWVAEPAWPSPNVAPETLALHPSGRLARGPAEAAERRIATPAGVGMRAGKWCSYAQPGDQPGEQAGEDALSLCFETAPLDAPLEIAGAPEAVLDLAADAALAQVAVRLVDVAPDGRATRVSFGVLNLAHRESHAAPEPLAPGRRVRVRVPMKPVAQRFAAGNRVRLSISSLYFPMIWPAPGAPALTLATGESALVLPLRRPTAAGTAADAALAPFPRVETAPPLAVETRDAAAPGWQVIRDEARGETVLVVTDGDGRLGFPGGLEIESRATETYRIADAAPDAPIGEVVWTWALARGDWAVSSRTWTRLSGDAESFRVEARMEAFEGETRVHAADWDERIPRDML